MSIVQCCGWVKKYVTLWIFQASLLQSIKSETYKDKELQLRIGQVLNNECLNINECEVRWATPSSSDQSLPTHRFFCPFYNLGWPWFRDYLLRTMCCNVVKYWVDLDPLPAFLTCCSAQECVAIICNHNKCSRLSVKCLMSNVVQFESTLDRSILCT